MLIMICLIVGTILCFVVAGFCMDSWSDLADLVGIISLGLAFVGVIALIVFTVVIITVHANPEGKLAAYQAEKAMLEYRLDQKEYLNDNNVGMTELMEDITEYNSNLAKAQHGLKNPWVNWFYADYVNELTPIILDNSD